MNLTRIFSTALLMVVSCGMPVLAQKTAPMKKLGPTEFQACQYTYALCTYAPCHGTKTVVTNQTEVTNTTCDCQVIENGWSVGQVGCPVDQPNPPTIKSRYFPIRTYARCTNKRPWAMCLDSPCTIDPTDKTKAACTCTLKHDIGDYVVMPESPGHPSQCDSGIVSSATVFDVSAISDYLETQDNMPVYDILVVNTPNQKK